VSARSKLKIQLLLKIYNLALAWPTTNVNILKYLCVDFFTLHRFLVNSICNIYCSENTYDHTDKHSDFVPKCQHAKGPRKQQNVNYLYQRVDTIFFSQMTSITDLFSLK